MKRIKKERTHNIEDTHYACNEQMERLGADTPCCICFGHKCKQLKVIKKECDACKPREHGIVIVDKVEEGGRCIQCRRIVCSPKPTKIKCGLKHKHGYWNCCACCIQGEVKGEGAWGHVKECEFYPKIEIDEFKFAEKRYMLDLGVSREEQALADKLNEVIRAVNKLLSH